MKAKLLKKIRKRFTIVHYPKGIRLSDTFYNYNVFMLTDSDSGYYDKFCELVPEGATESDHRFCQNKAKTEKDCINVLLKFMLLKIRAEHPSLGSKGHNRTIRKKVWYLR